MNTDKNESLPLISIIVPVYNVEKYLGKCIESILAQTYKNIEVILVDDGAKDKSGEICDEYAKKDDRIRVIHKENGGQSDARNVGIKAAEGEYLGFIDADDYIDSDMYELLYSLAEKHGAEISMCDVYEVYEGAEVKQTDNPEEFCRDSEEAIKIIIEGRINYAYSVNKLYKKEVFEGIEFPVGIIFEDAAIMLKLLDNATRVAFSTARKYYYFHRENSSISSSFSKKDLSCISVQEQNYKYVCEKHPSLEKIARMRLYWSRFYVLDKMLLSDNVEKQEYMPHVRYIRCGIVNILLGGVLSRSRKIAALILLFSVKIYAAMVRKNEKKNKQVNK